MIVVRSEIRFLRFSTNPIWQLGLLRIYQLSSNPKQTVIWPWLKHESLSDHWGFEVRSTRSPKRKSRSQTFPIHHLHSQDWQNLYLGQPFGLDKNESHSTHTLIDEELNKIYRLEFSYKIKKLIFWKFQVPSILALWRSYLFLAICWFRVDDGWIILDERYDMVVICLNTKLTDIRKEFKFQNLKRCFQVNAILFFDIFEMGNLYQ